ncbi:MAG: CARDB domain-containing protein [Planctomycetota bacterium]
MKWPVWITSVLFLVGASGLTMAFQDVEIRDAISREFTVYVPEPGEVPEIRDVISREFTVYIPIPGEEPTITDAISREFTLHAPTPDLQPTWVITPSEGLVEQGYLASWRVTNAGEAPTLTSWTDRVWLSADQIPENGNDTWLGDFSAARLLNPGEFYERIQQFTFPTNPGTYYLIVTTDYNDAVGEDLAEDNNTAISAAIVVNDIDRPDLVVEVVTPPPSGTYSGSATSVEFVVRNQGAGPTNVPSWKDRVYLSNDSSYGGDIFLADATNPTFLEPDDSYHRIVSVNLPHDISGTYYIIVYTDIGGVLRETDETNNYKVSAAFEITLEPQPDLQVVSSIDADDPGLSGHTYQVSWTDGNRGDGVTDIGNWTDRVYFSDDNALSINPDDIYLGAVTRSGPPLLPDQDAPFTFQTVLPPDMSGDFYVKVAVDAPSPGTVSEYGHEDNNIAVTSSMVHITLVPGPDLTPISVSGPQTGLTGYPVTVSWQAQNIGAPGAHYTFSWYDGIYLSTDTVLDRGVDLLLGHFGQHVVLENGVWIPQSYSKLHTLTIPADVTPDTYYFILSVDDTSAVFEWSQQGGEDNNITYSGPIVVAHAQVDLQIAVGFDGKLPPSSGIAGTPFTLPWRVTNAGSENPNVSSWIDAVYLSSDELLGGDIPVTSRTHSGGLPPGQAYNAEVTATVPSVTPGPYFLLFITDSGNVVVERNAENNNLAPFAFEVTGERADLTVTSVIAPSTSTTGVPFPVQWTVTNSGTYKTNTRVWTNYVYLSADQDYDAGVDRLIGSKTHVGTLEPGQSAATQKDFTLGTDLEGTWWVIVFADGGDQVFESDNTNNWHVSDNSVAVQLAASANLIVANIAAPESALSGQPFTLQWEVRNIGEGATGVGLWTDAVYFSLDEFLDPSFDSLVGYYQHASALGPAETRLVSTQFTTPLGLSGSYYVLVWTDKTLRVFEDGRDDDNWAHSPAMTDITLPEPCDLSVVAVNPAPSGVLGQDIAIEWQITNLGSSPAAGSWYDSVFLSVDDLLDEQDRYVGRFLVDAGSPGLDPGETLVKNVTAEVPGVLPGDYHVIIRTDSLGQIAEVDETNNVTASAATIDLSALHLDVPGSYQGTLSVGDSVYFEMTPPAQKTVRLVLAHADPLAWAELYVREGDIPSPGRYDFVFDKPGLNSQTITIPTTTGGSYYVLARTSRGSGTFTLTADIIPFGVETIEPEVVGTGIATIELHGTRMDETVDVQLICVRTSEVVDDLEFAIVDGTQVLAAFDLTGKPVGPYTVRVIGSSEVKELPEVLTVEAAEALAIGLRLRPAESVRKGARGKAWLSIENQGNVNVPYSTFVLATPTNAYIEISSDELGQPDLETDGSVDSMILVVEDLGPSQTVEVPLFVYVSGSYDSDLLSFGFAGRPLDRGDFEKAWVDEVSEQLRLAVVADPDAEDKLLKRAQDQQPWYDAVDANLAFDPGNIYVPGEDLSVGRDWVSRIAVAAATDLDPGNDVNPSVIDLMRSALYATPFVDQPDVVTHLLPEKCNPAQSGDELLAVAGLILNAGSGCTATPTSDDPNEKIKPTGYGTEAHISPLKEVIYRVHFENQADAEGPAARVEIVDALDEAYKASSFRLKRIQFGETRIDIPPDHMVYRDTIDLTETQGVYVEILAAVDAETREVFWQLQAIDPETGEPPTSGEKGFLPPEDGTGRGRGVVEFGLMAQDGVTTGTVVRNDAGITFDANPPIDTIEVQNIFDTDLPESSLTADLIDPQEGTIRLSVTSAETCSRDGVEGSGLSGHTVYVSENGGPFVALVIDTEETEILFHAEPGKTYAFYSVAHDFAGNIETPPATPDGKIEFGTKEIARPRESSKEAR